MRISDWSSDVCSSDLPGTRTGLGRGHEIALLPLAIVVAAPEAGVGAWVNGLSLASLAFLGGLAVDEIGRASCRERMCKYVENSVDAVTLKKKQYSVK